MGFLGILACLVPVIIMPYYSVIGGWVVKYLLAYLTGQGSSASADGYFTGYITGTAEPLIFMIAFLLVVAVIIYRGVNHGIESFSNVLARYGNRQMFPNPTALPAAASTKPIDPENECLFFSFSISSMGKFPRSLPVKLNKLFPLYYRSAGFQTFSSKF